MKKMRKTKSVLQPDELKSLFSLANGKDLKNLDEDLLDKNYAKEKSRMVLSYIKKYNKDADKILELGAGLGYNLYYFPDKYNLWGIDHEKAYVKIARKIVPEGRILQADIKDFKINEKFDVIFCISDTLNYMPDFNSLKDSFENIRQHINDKGIFIFDLYKQNAPEILRGFEDITPFNNGYYIEKPLSNGNKILWDFEIFKKNNNGYKSVYHSRIEQKVFSEKRTSNLILENFSILERVDCKNLDNLLKDPSKELIICRKN